MWSDETHSRGVGGIVCDGINDIEIYNNLFDSCRGLRGAVWVLCCGDFGEFWIQGSGKR